MGGFIGNVVNASSGKRQIWQDRQGRLYRECLTCVTAHALLCFWWKRDGGAFTVRWERCRSVAPSAVRYREL